ncbi:MAG: hypothetical protein IJ400_06165 [Clostridia bacterium]|nr:hypothetical protein [Clostridia bacterium]
MQLEEYDMAFAKTEIICHGARATRIGERLIRQTWKYLKKTEFVKGNISENEREEMFNSISLTSLISYPDDIEKINTDCDIAFQIISSDDRADNVTLAEDRIKEIPSITLVAGEVEKEIKNATYISIDESEILDTFLDFFSVYTFPQEYGADFEELRPLFEHKGKISTEKSEKFNLCIFRKASRKHTLDNEIKSIEQKKENYILVSRMASEDIIKIYSI